MIKIGVIGCGKIAQVRHFPEYADNNGAKIEAVFDTDRARAEAMAEKYNAKVYNSYQEILENPEIGAVSVCTANATHCEITVAALEAGKHVLCEKPMAITLEECEKMVETSRKTSKYLMIGHNQRLAKAHMLARKLILSDEIGRIITFRTAFSHSGPETWTIDSRNIWFFDKKYAAFGAIADLGIHKTDLIHYLTGQKINGVTAYSGTLDKRSKDGQLIGVDDNTICIYRLSGGIVGTMTASWTNYGPEDNSTVLYGTKGVMHIYDDPKYSIIIEKTDGSRIKYETDQLQTNSKQTKSGVIDEWIQCLVEDKQPELSGEEALCSMKAIFAALKSAESGRYEEVN